MESGVCSAATKILKARGIAEEVKQEVDKMLSLFMAPRKIVKKLKKDGVPESLIPSISQLKNRRCNSRRTDCKVVTNAQFADWCRERYVRTTTELDKKRDDDVVVLDTIDDYSGAVFCSPKILRSMQGTEINAMPFD